MSNDFPPLTDILKHSHVSINDLIKHPDLQYEYKNKNQKLLQIILKDSSISYIIEAFHRAQDSDIIRRIIGIYASSNTSLLKNTAT